MLSIFSLMVLLCLSVSLGPDMYRCGWEFGRSSPSNMACLLRELTFTKLWRKSPDGHGTKVRKEPVRVKNPFAKTRKCKLKHADFSSNLFFLSISLFSHRKSQFPGGIWALFSWLSFNFSLVSLTSHALLSRMLAALFLQSDFLPWYVCMCFTSHVKSKFPESDIYLWMFVCMYSIGPQTAPGILALPDGDFPGREKMVLSYGFGGLGHGVNGSGWVSSVRSREKFSKLKL